MLDKRDHEVIMLKIIKDIYSNISISPYLGFKGGTACLLAYGLPRFSIDLDFDLLDQTKRELVFDEIGNILMKYGKLSEKRIKRFTIFFMMSYKAGYKKLKVEVNTRNFNSKYFKKDVLGIPMLVMTKDDMFAHKLVALTERGVQAARDLFDVWYFLDQGWPINKQIVEKRTNMKYKDYLNKCIEYIGKNYSSKNMLSGIGDLIDEKQKYIVKTKLKDDVLFLLNLELKKY